ncbi:hypothetical protein TNCV_3805451 [Trichonephila clavipes]|nr:hypothetical protein TNCV_3805451 [Trichonephila clavipes]
MKEDIDDTSSELVNGGYRLHFLDETPIILLLSTSGRGSLVFELSDRGWHVTSSSSVPLKIRRVGERCTLNLSRAQTSSRWCGS